MKRFARAVLILLAAMAGFRFLPGAAALWQAKVALPVLGALHRLTALLPFPVLEPLALMLALSCLRRRGRAAAVAVVIGMYALLWYPAYFVSPAGPRDAPGQGRLEALCGRLTDELNAAPLAFEAPYATAGRAAGVPWARVKPVRYPEWMRALGLSGLFAPWTGEALVDAAAPPCYLPFTCAHELTHLRGLADEGETNVAAWIGCLNAGGMYADSARLWALRYALGRLDAAARDRIFRRMSDRLRAYTRYSEPKAPSLAARLLGIGEPTRDYDALLGWLAEHYH